MRNRNYLCTEPYTIQLKEDNLPEPHGNYVAVRYLYCGICGGDYSTYLGRRNQYPISLGHEFVAEIIKTGKNVSCLSVGEKVISDFNYRCGKCHYCQTGRSHLCTENSVQLFSNRAFAEYGLIHQNYLIPISGINNLPLACFIEPLSCVIHAMKSFNHSPESHIFINGVGSIGTMTAFYLCKVLHYKNVYVYDVNISRLQSVVQCFHTKEYILDEVAPDIIVECTNQLDGVNHALQIALPGTTICIMSHLYGLNTSFIYEEICKKELNACFPLRNGDKTNLYQAMNFITKYWEDTFNILYGIFNNLNYIFQSKCDIPQNKQIFDIINADWDLTD